MCSTRWVHPAWERGEAEFIGPRVTRGQTLGSAPLPLPFCCITHSTIKRQAAGTL